MYALTEYIKIFYTFILFYSVCSQLRYLTFITEQWYYIALSHTLHEFSSSTENDGLQCNTMQNDTMQYKPTMLIQYQ